MTDVQQYNQQESPRLWLEVTITALFWGIWIYVVTPLVSLFLWFAGYQVFVEQMVTLGGYETFLKKLNTYGTVILCIITATIIWVNWNLRRYGHHNIRTHMIADVTLAESAAVAGVDETTLQQLQSARCIVLAFNEQDQVEPLEVNTHPRVVANT